MSSISSELLEILACPKCKGRIFADEESNTLICTHCQVAYPIRDGIPVMLMDEAKPLREE